MALGSGTSTDTNFPGVYVASMLLNSVSDATATVYPSIDDSGSVSGQYIGIAYIQQTVVSNEDGGSNVIAITLTDGTVSTFVVKNGSKGSRGEQGVRGADGRYYIPFVSDGGYLSFKCSEPNASGEYDIITLDIPFINDNAVASDSTWSSAKIVEALWPEFSETGNPVTFNSIGNSTLKVTTNFEPIQEGSGDPYPAGGGKNKFCVANEDITDLNGLIVTAAVGASELNFNGTVTGANVGLTVATSTEIPAGTYTISVHGLKNGDYMNGASFGDTTGTYLFLNLTDNAPKTFTINEPTVLKISCIGIADKTAYNNETVKLQVEAGSAATEYAPCSNIRPITGRDALNLNHAGKNLLPNTAPGTVVEHGVSFKMNEDGTVHVTGTNSNNGLFLYGAVLWTTLLKPGTYTFSGIDESAQDKFIVQLVNIANGEPFAYIAAATPTVSFTLTQETQVKMRCYVYNGAANINSVVKPQLELGSTATAYEPYQGELHTTQLGQTVYGGSYDWNAGELTAEWAMVTLTGNETVAQHTLGGYKRFQVSNVVPGIMPSEGANLNLVCSHYTTNSNPVVSNKVNNTICGGMATPTVFIRDDDRTDVTAFKEHLAAQYAAGTPVQIAYKLETPIKIQLEPQQITAFVGVNTLYGDGELTVTRRGDAYAQLEKLIEENSASPDVIKSAVNEYLAENPVTSGATAEQAAQIEKNKNDIAALIETGGTAGEDGKDGVDGEDGFSPTVTVTEFTGGHRVTITDVNGSQYFDVLDGENGVDGEDGEGVDYSTQEVALGVNWIDGKPIYRKVLNFGAVATGKEVLVGTLTNPDTIVSCTGIGNSGTATLPLPSAHFTLAYAICVWIKGSDVYLHCGSSRALTGGHMIVEYTKTTD